MHAMLNLFQVFFFFFFLTSRTCRPCRLAGQSLIETGAARLTQWLIFKVSFWTALITNKVKNTLIRAYLYPFVPTRKS